MRGGAMVVVAAMGLLFVSALSSATLWERAISTNETTPLLKIAQGDLQGIFQRSASGRRYMGFHGIPYAKPPIGALRFKAPEPAEPWLGVRKAQQADLCPQWPQGMKTQASARRGVSDAVELLLPLPGRGGSAQEVLGRMSEDCLYLNVFTPSESLPPSRLLPVLVYIHGGGYQSGSGDALIYGADFLMDHDLVVVTLNYRLGPLGFLASSSSEAPGNAGLKDQLLALHWVRDNIARFGGDPRQVTLYGCSAGSVAVHLHVLSPRSRGLFQAAAMSSGAAALPESLQQDADLKSQRLAEALGAPPAEAADPGRRVRFLRTVHWKDLMAGSGRAWAAGRSERLLINRWWWTPVLEPPGADAFLDRLPDDALRAGDFPNDVALMFGLNEREGSAYHITEQHMAKLRADPTLLLPGYLSSRVDAGGRSALWAGVRKLYFGGRHLGATMGDATRVEQVLGDESLAHGVHVSARWHLRHARAPVFLYYFVLDALRRPTDPIGAPHAIDQKYVFRNQLVPAAAYRSPVVQRGSARLAGLIANFAIRRNPTPTRSALLDVEWPAATAEEPVYLEIGDGLAVRRGTLLRERMCFWDDAARVITRDPVFDLPRSRS